MLAATGPPLSPVCLQGVSLMMTRPLPPILQQQGQQTAAALPAPADDVAISALAMSDFISDALISHPAWLQ
ncbi:hypothetical protein [Candidatus Sodalis pierantonius]|uniref:hypothetical protein n=1 Tax=Candidatus Sodalis pierantonii TaxID=1486991 RepID=UPI003AA7C582